MSAPISAPDLQAVLEPFGHSRMLPGEAYTSSELLAWELEHIYAGTWVCVGRTLDLPEAGAQLGVAIGATQVLLTRAEDGEVRGFFNVCSHRGHELIGCGEARNAGVVKCPYHAWTFGLEGTLANPRHCEEASFDPADFGLVPVSIDEWGGWLFVNVSGSAAGLAAYTGERLDTAMAAYGADQLVEAARDDYVVNANWKLIIENYHECYHCALIHPELSRVSPADSGYLWHPDGAWVGGSMDIASGVETMSLTGESGAAPLPGLGGAQLRQVLYLELFPSLLISAHPDYIMTHTFQPLATDRTRVECRWLFAPDTVNREDFDPAYARDFWHLTNQQDWAVCEGAQRGMDTGAYRAGPLSDDEEALYHHLAMLAHTYRRGAFDPRWADELALPESRTPPPSILSF
ncbi:MAG TPA: aromatic ring-hydroxylating dioxygenase subunit alpha [Acidobacteriota bacterium]|nr:aromatic ring-hydroxylating dioxygenase subunit alpha [Acidobacteriota bacterium]